MNNNRIIKISLDELQRIVREQTIEAVSMAVQSLREKEIIISQKRYSQGEEAIKQIANQEDVFLKGSEVAKLLGCTSGQITKLKIKGVLEPVYLMGSRTPKYSRNKIEKMIRERTIPCFNKKRIAL